MGPQGIYRAQGAFDRRGPFEDRIPDSDTSWGMGIRDGAMRALAHKVLTGRRLSREEGTYLMTADDLSTVCELADRARRLRVGEGVLFATTLFIHPTNLCELSCPMCSYYAKPGQAKAWFHSPETIIEKVRAHLVHGINEVHIVGGLWREANLAYYEAILRGIKSLNPSLHIKALTPVEFDYLAQLHGIEVECVLRAFKEWGLGSIPGGGAEILDEDIRKQIAPQKITSDRYLDIHTIAHRLEIPTNITMLFGHVEDVKDLVTHWERVRHLQDETGGIQAFVPLRYHDENNALGKRRGRLKPKDLRRIYAVSRLMLDNVPDLKVLWNYVGLSQAQELLCCGANDMGSTAIDEGIATAAGGIQLAMDQGGMRRAILALGRRPQWIHSGKREPTEALFTSS